MLGRFWEISPLAWVQLLGGFCVALWLIATRSAPWQEPRRWGKVHNGLLLFGLVAALAIAGLQADHGKLIHRHDVYHYYLGAKYFPELRYAGLYRCTVLADVQDGLAGRPMGSLLRNLETNLWETTQEVSAHPERCLGRFTAPNALRSGLPVGVGRPGEALPRGFFAGARYHRLAADVA